MPELTSQEWDIFLQQYPHVHILQTSAWGSLKSSFGWSAFHISTGDVGAQVLFRQLPFGFTLAYIPKGPLGANWDQLWPKVDALCRRKRSVFLKVEPDLWQAEADSLWGGAPPPGFRLSSHDIQPSRTLVVDLQPEEEVILGRMKQKTRYNIRLAARKGVVVRPTVDVDAFSGLMDITGERAEFGVHSLDYYRRAYEIFHPLGMCELLSAEYQGEMLAAIMVFVSAKRAWYFYGASSNKHRNLMPTYLLQWQAILWARERGCTHYDLWGVPDTDLEALEQEFTNRQDGLWGVYRFKRGFGGELCRAAGPWDRIYNPALYAFYRWLVQRG